MFDVNPATGAITMHQGDTGSFTVQAARASGEPWTENDRMLYTIKNATGTIVLQRIYRLDDAFGLGDGVVLIQFHNNDTDTWEPGQYTTERRYDIAPIWKSGEAPEGACVDALATGDRMTDGGIVRTTFQGTLEIKSIQGEI